MSALQDVESFLGQLAAELQPLLPVIETDLSPSAKLAIDVTTALMNNTTHAPTKQTYQSVIDGLATNRVVAGDVIQKYGMTNFLVGAAVANTVAGEVDKQENSSMPGDVPPQN